MTGTGGGITIPKPAIFGFEILPANVPLQGTPSGQWTNTGLQVSLPASGTYELDASVRCNLSGTSPVNTFVVARLFDVTNNVVVPDSEMLILQHIISVAPGTTSAAIGGNQNAPIPVHYTVTGPTVIELQAQRTNSTGSSNNANIISDVNGRTTLKYSWISP